MNVDSDISIADLELTLENLDARKAAEIYEQHGCLVVRGLMSKYVDRIRQDIEQCVATGIGLLDQANECPEGWTTPDGSLFLPAPEQQPDFPRDKQLMVAGCSYTDSGALFSSALDPSMLDIVEAILGPDIELYMEGQVMYKEPGGGYAKNLHQDELYFQHVMEGPVGVLCYTIPTNLDNGALYVVPGSHKLGLLQAVDSFSHLALDPHQWPWEKATPILGEPGDAIFFHVKVIHGSRENRTGQGRAVFIHRYRHVDDYSFVTGTTVEKIEESRKHADEASKANQRGFVVRGRRTYSDHSARENYASSKV